MERDEAEKQLGAAMENLHVKRLEPHILKSKRLIFRMHDEEFEEVKNTAESLNMSVSEYFCTLHRYAVKRLQVPPGEAEWVHRTPRKSRRADDE